MGKFDYLLKDKKETTPQATGGKFSHLINTQQAVQQTPQIEIPQAPQPSKLTQIAGGFQEAIGGDNGNIAQRLFGAVKTIGKEILTSGAELVAGSRPFQAVADIKAGMNPMEALKKSFVDNGDVYTLTEFGKRVGQNKVSKEEAIKILEDIQKKRVIEQVTGGIGMEAPKVKTAIETLEVGAKKTVPTIEKKVAQELPEVVAKEPIIAPKQPLQAPIIEDIGKVSTIEQQAPQAGKFDHLIKQDPLIQEAKNYKSADEFVKAKANLMHGSSEGGIGGGDYGVYLTPSKKYATTFATNNGKIGKIENAYADIKNTYQIPKGTNSFTGESNDFLIERPQYMQTEIKRLIAKGYDSIKSSDGRQILVLDKNKVITKSQLTDIWNKAQVPEAKNLIPKVNPNKPDIEALQKEIKFLEGTLKSDPARNLAKYANKNGELGEILGNTVLDRQKGIKRGVFQTKGDTYLSEMSKGLWETEHDAQKAYSEYLTTKNELTKAKQELINLKEGTAREYTDKQLDELNRIQTNAYLYDQKIVGQGEKGSAFAERLNKELPVGYKLDEYYEVAKISDDATKASEQILKDKQKAIRIGKGIEKSDDVTQTAINIELGEIAKRNDNWAEVNELWNIRMQANRRRGQELNMEKMSVLLNPQEKFMKDVVNARLGKLKVTGEDLAKANEKIVAKVKQIKTTIKEATKGSIKIEKAQALLDSLICK